jgi:hypothetical protein
LGEGEFWEEGILDTHKGYPYGMIFWGKEEFGEEGILDTHKGYPYGMIFWGKENFGRKEFWIPTRGIRTG